MNFLRILLCLLLPIGIYAQSDHEKYVEAKLISEVKWMQPGQPFWVALRLQMAPGWHTYWRNPGDAGLPTKIEWDLPDGFSAGEIRWPFPERFANPPLVSYGYTDQVLLLVQLQPPASLQPGTSVPLKARASWLVCKEACFPGSAELILTLPVKATQPELDPHSAKDFTETRQKLPIDDSLWTVSAFQEQNVLTLTVTPPKESKQQVGRLIFCPYEEM
ncbi:thiol:disulfide interchange protein, partial [candidate division KSB1 bacterium]|nr:thiol:disulfide interchange protein [candidate division KSB1 bacterium]NIR73060.1 thiol:disulfide interchange protein [candidate division KSB1 bacterium]NIT70757.1 thiol:disulfide interchange protein [candidate division KSB1 bacterium]NIU94367.1 thiol:disulfide interchange protein [candidate division KSB1 bacterium]NIW68845.1 thiol:disulfide interchange protein [candidate division KSB1 bacterium]